MHTGVKGPTASILTGTLFSGNRGDAREVEKRYLKKYGPVGLIFTFLAILSRTPVRVTNARRTFFKSILFNRPSFVGVRNVHGRTASVQHLGARAHQAGARRFENVSKFRSVFRGRQADAPVAAVYERCPVERTQVVDKPPFHQVP